MAAIAISLAGIAAGQTFRVDPAGSGGFASPQEAVGTQFTERERADIADFWSGRYRTASPVHADGSGPYQVRLTVAGSKWLWDWAHARGLGKGETLADNPSLPTDSVEVWIDKQVAYDRYVAQLECDRLNHADSPRDPVTKPDPIDVASLRGLPAPPRFAEAVYPTLHIVEFDDLAIAYQDNVPMRPRYAYYRFSDGVMSGGRALRTWTPDELRPLLQRAGIDDRTARIMSAVSMLEGGFDSVNTYDTGFVSVGLIQFASLSAGAGSLGACLLNYKQSDPDDFRANFHRFGIEVTPTGQLVALDLDSQRETVGPDANAQIIRDKRLIAVFQRAGQVSDAFRCAQLRTVVAQYFPAKTPVTLDLGDRVLSGTLDQVFVSEAGMATLLDRKVNTGGLGSVLGLLREAAVAVKAQSLSDLAAYEAELTEAMRFRRNFLADSTLSQPPAPARYVLSRNGKRNGRG